MKLVAEDNIRITPDVMTGGAGGSEINDALMGTILKGMITGKGPGLPGTQPSPAPAVK